MLILILENILRLYKLVENRNNNLTICVIRLNIKMLFGFFILNLYPPNPFFPSKKGEYSIFIIRIH